MSTGRSRTNNCELLPDLSLTIAGSATGVTMPRLPTFCDVRPPMLPNLKFLGVYPLPWWGLQASATLQSTPGPEITATYAATNAEISPSLGRNLSSGQNGTVLVDLIASRHVVRRAHQPARLSDSPKCSRSATPVCRGCSTSTTHSTRAAAHGAEPLRPGVADADADTHRAPGKFAAQIDF